MEIALRIFSTNFNPLQMNFIRFFIGSLLLTPLAIRSLRKRGVKLEMADFRFFALSGFICVVVSMTLYQLAVMSAKASIVAILFSCNPIFVIPLAYFILGEKIYKSTIISLLLSLVGIVFIMNPFQLSASVSGIVLTLLAAATFALYGVNGKRRTQKYGGVALTAYSFLFGSIEMLIVILITKIGFVADILRGAGLGKFADVPILRGITLQSLPGLLYIGIFVTGLGYAFYLLSMEETSASTASLVFYIKPALAPVLAFLILREPITVMMLIGIAFIIAGSVVTFTQSHSVKTAPDSGDAQEIGPED